MTKRFTPHLDILPPAQLTLWPQLKPAQDLGFVLYGGTAIALRLGHRSSIDFDFFSSEALDRAAISAAFDFVPAALTRQEAPDTWVMAVPAVAGAHSHVQVAFYGGISFGRVGEPELADDEVLLAASLQDLMGTKLKVILQRAEKKDYQDIAALVRAGGKLEEGLGAARALYGQAFQPAEAVKALTYFADGDLDQLSDADCKLLVEAATGVTEVPEVALASHQLIV